MKKIILEQIKKYKKGKKKSWSNEKKYNLKKNDLDFYRKKIDLIDKKIIYDLNVRFSFVKKIWEYKKKNNINSLQKDRWKKVLDSVIQTAKTYGFSENFIKNLWNLIHKESLKLEENIKK